MDQPLGASWNRQDLHHRAASRRDPPRRSRRESSKAPGAFSVFRVIEIRRISTVTTVESVPLSNLHVGARRVVSAKHLLHDLKEVPIRYRHQSEKKPIANNEVSPTCNTSDTEPIAAAQSPRLCHEGMLRQLFTGVWPHYLRL